MGVTRMVRLLTRVWCCVVVAACSSGSNRSSSDSGPAVDPDAGGTNSITGATSAQRCQRQYDYFKSKCPDPQSALLTCQQLYRELEGIGCDNAVDTWLSCTLTTDYDCDRGPLGCTQEENAYFACQAAATSRTGCVTGGSNSTLCRSPAPYLFRCQGQAPSGCLAVTDAGAGAFCCPKLGGGS